MNISNVARFCKAYDACSMWLVNIKMTEMCVVTFNVFSEAQRKF